MLVNALRVYAFCYFSVGEVMKGSVVAWAGHATYGIFLAWVTGCSGTSTGAVFGVSSI